MRPFISGGKAVWCKKLTPAEIADLTVGDIIWFKNGEQGTRIHRLVAKVPSTDGRTTLITRGDPMTLAESMPCSDVLGIALYAETSDSVIISLTKGFSGLLCKSYGKATAWIHAADRLKAMQPTTLDRDAFFFRGYLFKLFFPCVFLTWSILFLPYLWIAGFPGRKGKTVQAVKNLEFLCSWLNNRHPSATPNFKEIALLLDHELAGLCKKEHILQPEWRPIKEQKTRQLFFALKAHIFWQELFHECKRNAIQIMPIKGLSLSLTIYKNDPSLRRFGDIDILLSPDHLFLFNTIMTRMGYVPKKQAALQKKYQRIKQKVEYLPEDPNLPDLDIHTAFIVKKILARHTEISLQDIFSRARTIETDIGEFQVLDRVDEWLYLAYHLTLHHRFSGLKWLKDLFLITKEMNDEEWQCLVTRASAMELKKITLATLLALETFFPLPAFCATRPADTFGLLAKIHLGEALNAHTIIKHKLKHGGATLLSKVGAAFWELLFIDQQTQQKKAVFTLLFPSHDLLKTIIGQFPYALYVVITPAIPLFSMTILFLYFLDSCRKAIFQFPFRK